MTPSEADAVIAKVVEQWSRDLTEGKYRLWRASLLPVPYEVALGAVAHFTGNEPPTHQEFLAVARPSGRDHGGRCPKCGGTGMRQVPVQSGAEAYSRCDCLPPIPPKDRHRSGCSCHLCVYGPSPKPLPDDPLLYVGSEPEGMF